MKKAIGALVLGLVGSLVLAVPQASAALTDSGSLITLDSGDFYGFPSPTPTGTGIGTLDLILFDANSTADNKITPNVANYDDANTDLPTGSVTETTEGGESYATTLGELRDFYTREFSDGSGGSTVNDLILFININEEGQPQTIQVDAFNIILDFTNPALSPGTTDLSKTQQNAINGSYTSGNGLWILDLGASVTLTQIHTGIGQPDAIVNTGFDPFATSFGGYTLSDSTKILFNWSSSLHTDGGEVIYLSGDFNQTDLCVTLGTCEPPPPPPPTNPVPEPSSMLLLGGGLLGLLGFGWSKRSS